jgi:hypothetical protein
MFGGEARIDIRSFDEGDSTMKCFNSKLLPILLLLLNSAAMVQAATATSNSTKCVQSVAVETKSLEVGDGPGTRFENSISLAALTGNIAELKRLIHYSKSHYSSKYVTQWLNTALNQAVRANHLRATRLLIHYGAQVNAEAYAMQTVYTKLNASDSILQNNEATGRDVHEHYLWLSGTPLANAASCEHVKMSGFLLDNGADMYASRIGGEQEFRGEIVYIAVMSGSNRLVRVFIKHGLNSCRVHGPKFTLEQLAKRTGLSPALQAELACRADSLNAIAGHR